MGGIMKVLRNIGSMGFILGLFIAIFAGIPWYVMVADDPIVPWWLRIAIFSLLGGILLVLGTIALGTKLHTTSPDAAPEMKTDKGVLLQSANVLPGREITEILGLVQGHSVYAIWLGKDLSAIVRLILGGELTEYTEMMASARATATERMTAIASAMGADAVINVRYTTTSVVGSASELLVYGTAVKLS
jgi:uncharacterized protein YbjQ (UPF0145 family)